MNLTTSEKFLLLIHHPEKSRYLVHEPVRKAGLIGSVLLDLSLGKNIEITNKRLRVITPTTNLSFTHKQILERIATSVREKKVKTWIMRFANRNRKYRHQLLYDLSNKGIIRIEEKQFLFFPYKKTYLINREVREELINKLRNTIIRRKISEDEMILILSLINACKIYKIISRDRQELKQMKKTLKEIIKEDPIAQGIETVIKEINAAIIAAVAASTAAASSSH